MCKGDSEPSDGGHEKWCIVRVTVMRERCKNEDKSNQSEQPWIGVGMFAISFDKCGQGDQTCSADETNLDSVATHPGKTAKCGVCEQNRKKRTVYSAGQRCANAHQV